MRSDLDATPVVTDPDYMLVEKNGIKGKATPGTSYPGLPIQPWSLGALPVPFALSPIVVGATVAGRVASVALAANGSAVAGAVMNKAFASSGKQWLAVLPDYTAVANAIFSDAIFVLTTSISGMLANTGPGITVAFASGAGLQLISQPGNVVVNVDAAYTENQPFLVLVTGATGVVDVTTPQGTFTAVATVPVGSTAYGILELFAGSASCALSTGLSTDPNSIGGLPVPGGGATPLR